MIKGLGFWARSGEDGRLYFYETAIDTWWYVVGGQTARIKASRLPKDVAGPESGRCCLCGREREAEDAR